MTSFLMFLLLVSTSVFAHIVDFGVHGPQYKINEVDIEELIEKNTRELNSSLVKGVLKDNIQSSLISKINISTCSENQKDRSDNDYLIAPIDVILPDGTVLSKKGNKIFLSSNTILPDVDLCIVDGTNEEQMIEDINQFYQKNHNCSFVINRYSLEKFKKKFPQVKNAYILNEALVKRFHVDCLPVWIHLHRNKIEHLYLHGVKNDK